MAVVATMLAALFATCESGMLGEIRQASQAAQAAAETQYYTVTYDGNVATSGEVPVDDATYEQGHTVTVLGNVGGLAKDGHNFAGWNTAADGHGTSYGAGAGFQMGTADVTLYARWTQLAVYEVSFNSQGGSPVPPMQHVIHGGLVDEPVAHVPTRTGYTFGGWFRESTGDNEWDFAADTVTANRTLYAKWTGNQYTVTFNPMGGTTPSPWSSKPVTFHSPYGPLPETNRAGYALEGWWTRTDPAERVTPTTTVSIASNHTLDARWTGVGYTVFLDRQNGTPPQGFIATYGEAMPTSGPFFDVPPPPLVSYAFSGFYTQRHGEGAMYYDDQMASVRTWDIPEDNHTLYASWSGRPPAPTDLSISKQQMTVGQPGFPNYQVYYRVTVCWSVPDPSVFTGFEVEWKKGEGSWFGSSVVDESVRCRNTTFDTEQFPFTVNARVRTLNRTDASVWVNSSLVWIP